MTNSIRNIKKYKLEVSYDNSKDFIMNEEINRIILIKDFIEKRTLINEEIIKFVSQMLIPRINGKYNNKKDKEYQYIYECEKQLVVKFMPQDIWVYFHFDDKSDRIIYTAKITHFFEELSVNGDALKVLAIEQKENSTLQEIFIEINKKLKYYLMGSMY